ncbi:MAG: hypothetical protein ABW186_10335 [Rhodanobacteraceae bacterium]
MHRSSVSCALAALAATTVTPVIAAQAWESKGPYGGYVDEVVTRADRQDLVFAIAVGGLFRSIDGGEHWSRADAGIEGSIVGASPGLISGSLVLDPLDRDGAWVFDDDGKLYHSFDAGRTWTRTGFASTDATLLTLAVDAGSPQHLYLGTAQGILRSDDLGATFVLLGDGVAPRAASTIMVDPDDNAHVFGAGAYDASTPGTPFFHSLDFGASWLPAASPCNGSGLLCTVARDMSPTSNGGGLVASTPYVFGSSDGSAWAPIPIYGVTSVSTNGNEAALIGGEFGLAFTSNLFHTAALANNGLSLDGANPLEVQSTRLFPGYPAHGPWFAGTYIDGIYRSDDDGLSWHAANEGLAATRIASLAIDPHDASHGFAGGAITGSFMGGRALWATSLHGDLWVPVAHPPDAFTIRSIRYDPTTSGAATTIYATGIYAGARGDATPTSGLYKSTNGGVDWSVLDGGLPPPYGVAGAMWKLALDPRSCAAPPPQGPCTSGPLQVLYVTSSGAWDNDAGALAWRVIRSADAGATWTSADAGLPQEIVPEYDETITTRPIVVDPVDGNVVYVGTYLWTDGPYASAPGIENGVFRSDDAGAHWTFRSTGLPRYPGATNTAYDVIDLAIHPTDRGTLWAALSNLFDATSGTVYKTVDGGANWFASGAGLTLAKVTTLLVDPDQPDTIYAGGSSMPGSRISIFRSDDGGAHWRPMPGSPTSHVTALAIDPDDRTRLLAGTQTGVWVSVDAIFADEFDLSAVP